MIAPLTFTGCFLNCLMFPDDAATAADDTKDPDWIPAAADDPDRIQPEELLDVDQSPGLATFRNY